MGENERLANLTRKELVAGAAELGILRPELLTRAELVAEITRVGEGGAVRRSAGFFGVARALLASVVEQGLNLPDAAKLIRGSEPPEAPPAPAPLPTITLAQIYAAQGHTKKALGTAQEILRAEPEHEAARKLVERLRSGEGPVAQKTSRAGRGAAIGVSRAASAEPLEPSPPPDVVEGSTDEAVVASAPAPPLAPKQTPASEASDGEAPTSGSVVPQPFLIALWRKEAATGKGACELRWRADAAVARRASERWGAGNLCARVLALSPRAGVVHRMERDVLLDAEEGVTPLDDVEPPCELRAALGWRVADGFHVVSTALVMEQVAGEPPRTLWKPRAGVDAAALAAQLADRL